MPSKRRRLLEAGVTSIHQLGDPRDAILEVKRLLDARELAGPRLFVAGPIFTAPGGEYHDELGRLAAAGVPPQRC